MEGMWSTYSFNNVRLALQSQYFSSHCAARYCSKVTTASGLYLSRPLMMLTMASGRSGGSSPFILGNLLRSLSMSRLFVWWGFVRGMLYFANFCEAFVGLRNGIGYRNW